MLWVGRAASIVASVGPHLAVAAITSTAPAIATCKRFNWALQRESSCASAIVITFPDHPVWAHKRLNAPKIHRTDASRSGPLADGSRMQQQRSPGGEKSVEGLLLLPGPRRPPGRDPPKITKLVGHGSVPSAYLHSLYGEHRSIRGPVSIAAPGQIASRGIGCGSGSISRACRRPGWRRNIASTADARPIEPASTNAPS